MNPVVHFELPYDNRDRITKFYQSAFGWQLEKLGQEMGNYVIATTANTDAKPGAPAGAINGGFYERKVHFLQSVPYALKNLRWLLHNTTLPVALPTLTEAFRSMVGSEKLQRLATDADRPRGRSRGRPPGSNACWGCPRPSHTPGSRGTGPRHVPGGPRSPRWSGSAPDRR